MTPQNTAGQRRGWQGPALFSYGFRPFFLFGALWAFFAMCLWIALLADAIDLPTRFDHGSWHAHEFLFGYLGAVIAGFLLTAVPNWTGRMPVVGWPLAGLFAVWLVGRIGILFSEALSPYAVLVLDIAFPVVLGTVILREIIAGRNWRNLVVLALIAIFTLANAVFHLEALSGSYAAQGIGLRLGIATALMMIAVIGGRIVPSFTRNWLVRQQIEARPAAPMQRFDKIAVLSSLPILALWTIRPEGILTGLSLLVLGTLHFIRLARWQGHRTVPEPLLLILHVSYAFVPLGALALGLEQFLDISDTAGGQHLWMVGAIGGMTLSVMIRATLGHTGQALVADRGAIAIYLCIAAAALARFLTPLVPEMTYLSGVLWVLAFAGFVLKYGPLLSRKP